MTDDVAISEATFDALRKDLDNERMVDLVVTISLLQRGRAPARRASQIDVEPEYQPYLDEFPLPAPAKGKAR